MGPCSAKEGCFEEGLPREVSLCTWTHTWRSHVVRLLVLTLPRGG